MKCLHKGITVNTLKILENCVNFLICQKCANKVYFLNSIKTLPLVRHTQFTVLLKYDISPKQPVVQFRTLTLM